MKSNSVRGFLEQLNDHLACLSFILLQKLSIDSPIKRSLAKTSSLTNIIIPPPFLSLSRRNGVLKPFV